MIILTKTVRSSLWHVKDDTINETICGKILTRNWNNKSFNEEIIPMNNICKKCLKQVKLPVQADITHVHYTW